MTDWVHCNTCFRQPAGNGPKFALTNCGHIYCSDCVEAGTKDKCRMCGNPCTTITLSAKMKPDVEMFFTDPAEIVKKQQKQLITVLDFQKNHRQRLTAHRREMQGKQMLVVESAQVRVKEMESENSRLREENRKLRSLVSGSPGLGSSAKLASRQGTPRAMRNSPASTPSSSGRMAHQTPSPSKSRSSPYGRLSYPLTPSAMDITKAPMQSPAQVTPGPARYSIRTPPSGGRMGTIIPPTSCGSSQPVMPKSSAVKQLTGHTPPGTPNYMSPMSSSPSSYQSRGSSSLQERKPTPGPGGDPVCRKQIQLNYTPHRRPPILSAISASQP